MRRINAFLPVLALGISTATLAACDEAYDPGAPAIDPNAPRVHITTPERGTFAGDREQLLVKGTATDDEGVRGVTVNGVTASLQDDGTFEALVTVEPGTFLLHAVAMDEQGNKGKDTRAVVVGPTEPLAQQVRSSITANLTADAFDAIGRGLSGFITSPSLMTTVAPMNPVVNAGAENGPDCLYAQASITAIDMRPTSKIILQPQVGGIWIDATLDFPRIDLSTAYAVACADGSGPAIVRADKIRVTGVLKMGVNGQQFAIHLANQDVKITNLDVDMGGAPGAVIDMLSLDTAMGPVLGFITERVAVPYLNRALAGLNETKMVDVLGKQVQIKVSPASIDVDVTGAIVELDTELRAQGDEGSPGFVYIPNIVPTMDSAQSFQLAVADDAANQLLGSFWAAKGMDARLELDNGSYGEVGMLYDSVELSAKVPPFIDASGHSVAIGEAGGLRLTVGDLMATFRSGEHVATQVAINAQLEVKIVAGPDATLRLDVGAPEVFIDVMDEGVVGANQLSNAQFEAVASFAVGRIVAFGSGALGAVPVPSFGGVGVTQLSIGPEAGYLVVGGDIQ